MSNKTRHTIHSLKNVFFTLAVIFSTSIIRSQVDAATYFISPTGSDSNSGNSSSPWKTFGFAIPKLRAGDNLILRDGTYNASNSGYPNIDCSAGPVNGTAAQPITIKAENERQAFVSGSGNGVDPLKMRNCSWWVIEGLRVANTISATPGGEGNIVLNNSNNITIRRNLVHQQDWGSSCVFASNTSCNNTHMIAIQNSSGNVIEENEIYTYHRHGMYLGIQGGSGSNNNIIRRNYCNARRSPTIHWGNCIVPYPGSNNIIENNLSESNAAGFAIEAVNPGSNGNKFYGNISLKEGSGMAAECRGPSTANMFQNTVFKDFVVVGANETGFYLKGSINAQVNGVSALNGNASGFIGTIDALCSGFVSSASLSAVNILASGNAGPGIVISSVGTATLDYTNAFQSNPSYSLSGATSTRSSTSNPSLGTCIVWIPASSPMKGAGLGGADIGANVLYRYQNGTLTNQPLWDPVTGEFPHGAIVAGVNDNAGSSLFDVHKRLNVNTNGCSFPAGYASAAAVAQTSPSSTGPVGSWNFDEGSGTSVSDASGNGNMGTLFNGPIWTSGVKGTALSLDGVDDYVDMGIPPPLNITGPAITVQAWIKANSPGNYKYIVSKTDGLYMGYGLYTGSSGTLRFYVGNGSGLITTPDVTSPWDNRWHHIAATYDGSKLNLYIDGVVRASVAATGNIADSSARSLNIGRFSEGGFSFKGIIDDVQIYNRALSATEIQQLYNAVPVVRPSSPVNLIVTK